MEDSGNNLKLEPLVRIYFSSLSHTEAGRKIPFTITVMVVEGYNIMIKGSSFQEAVITRNVLRGTTETPKAGSGFDRAAKGSGANTPVLGMGKTRRHGQHGWHYP